MLLSFKIALSSLAAHRLRTLLAMTGVLLGALALCGVQHVSEALLRKAEEETAKLGTNLFVARSGKVTFTRSGSARLGEPVRTFKLADARALLAHLPSVRRGVPFAEATMPIRAGDTKIPCQLNATWPLYTAVRNVRPAYGRFFTEEELDKRARVCVLGRKIAERLFGGPERAVGQTVFFFRAPVRVVGVTAPKGADIAGTDQDEQVFVPLTTYLRRFANQDWITGAYLQLADPRDYDLARQNVRDLLRRRHRLGPGEEDDFTLLTAKDTMRVQQQALDLVQTLGLISSSISFAVGGLGILSIMILLVRTRRLEIGVRRAVGARRRDIVRQFMFEAGLMAGVGGALGVSLALGLLLVVYRLGQLPLVFDPRFIAAPLFGSLALGLAAGAYPAWQAAHVEVLEVLAKE